MNLEFQFSSLLDFWHMSGHGPYVWSAFAITFGGLIALALSAQLKKKQVKKLIKVAQLRSAQLDAELDS